uniref:Gustatory receptor n=1 Tax=Bombyx mori TaxID=7091 RepID=B7FF49_BOMMO|nr:TPA_inf: gustatory receptor 64 [Bombyx mori]
MKISLRKIVSIRNMTLIQNMFGFYHKFTDNRAIGVLLKIFCGFYSLFLSFLCINCTPRFTNDFLTYDIFFFVIEYLTSVLVCLLYDGQYFLNYLYDLKLIDREAGIEESLEKLPISQPLFSLIFITRVIYLLSCLLMFDGIKDSLFLPAQSSVFGANFTEFARTIGYFPRVIMFEMFYKRVNYLKSQLRNDLAHANLYPIGFVCSKVIMKYINFYKLLLRNLQQNSLQFKILMSMSSLYIIIKALASAYAFIYREDGVHVFIFIEFATGVFLFFVMSSIIISIFNEIEDIRQIVLAQLRYCKQGANTKRVQDALTILNIRCFKYALCRIYTVDFTFILRILDVSVTYVIVLVQFTHILD